MTGAQRLAEAQQILGQLQVKANELSRTRDQLISANNLIKDAVQKASTSIKNGNEVMQKLQAPAPSASPTPTPASAQIPAERPQPSAQPPTDKKKESSRVPRVIPQREGTVLTNPLKL
jgi:hypothetical protein